MSKQEKPYHVFIGTSTHGVPCAAFFESMHKLLFAMYEDPQIKGKLIITQKRVGGCGIPKARNKLVYEMRKTAREHLPVDRLLFVDSDIGFEPWHVLRLCQRDQSIVCGPYPLKTEPPVWCCNTLPGAQPLDHGPNDPRTALQEMQTMGTGFMCIKPYVFDKMERDYPERAYIEDFRENYGTPQFAFFNDEVADGRYLTEDWNFCRLARKSGFKIWGDMSFNVKHYGEVCFPRDQMLPVDNATPYDAKKESPSTVGDILTAPDDVN